MAIAARFAAVPASVPHSLCVNAGPLPPPAAGWRYQMRRNCALTPQQVVSLYGALGSVCTIIGAAFWLLGYPLIAAFVLIEWVGIACALLCYAQHACDRETLVLDQGRLHIEQCCGRDVRRITFVAAWVRVECADARDRLVGLSVRDQRVAVGRYLQAHQRDALARELRNALRGAAVG
jgi:uncharacterized membrane protein